MDEADGACDRDEGDREKLLCRGYSARQRQVGDGPGTAGGAEHTMLAMRVAPGAVLRR